MTKEEKKLFKRFANNMIYMAVKYGKLPEETSALSYMLEGYSGACFEYGYKIKMLIETFEQNQQTKRKKKNET